MLKRRRVHRRDENVYCVMCEDLGCCVCHTVCESVQHCVKACNILRGVAGRNLLDVERGRRERTMRMCQQ